MTRQEVMQKIAKIGSGSYRDGSSQTPGMTYHPIPFDDFAGVKAHKTNPIMHEHSLMRDVLVHEKIEPKSILDIGCNMGFHSFKFEQEYNCPVYGLEADPAVYDALIALRDYQGSNLKVYQGVPAGLESVPPVDLTVFLNCHMWVWKQGGARKTLEWVFKNSEYMFFQTAGLDSGGMYQIPLTGEKEIRQYLEGFGFGVELVDSVDGHGGKRHLFFCES